MLTMQEIELVNNTKKHWIEDIKTRLTNGEKVYGVYPSLIWKDGTKLKCSYNDCPFCLEYFKKDGNCKRCLFLRVLGKDCAFSGGLDFMKNPSLENCERFINNFDLIIKIG